jgi:hypothetical protein
MADAPHNTSCAKTDAELVAMYRGILRPLFGDVEHLDRPGEDEFLVWSFMQHRDMARHAFSVVERMKELAGEHYGFWLAKERQKEAVPPWMK